MKLNKRSTEQIAVMREAKARKLELVKAAIEDPNTLPEVKRVWMRLAAILADEISTIDAH